MGSFVMSPRLIGRDVAFAQLGAALDRVATGEASTVLVSGPSGVGVSRFLAEAADRLGGDGGGWTVALGRAHRAGTDEPFGPIRRAL
jgi:hypothetical protein